ncbi:MAG: DUF4199 family protein [Flavobacteriales bacterium]|nr:DUF4199 family protein [Flavobacteriales bacterium]
MRKAFGIGIFFGLILLGLTAVLAATGKSPFWKWRYVGSWLPPVAVAWAVYQGRPKEHGRFYPFREALSQGLWATLALASTKAMGVYIALYFFPELLELHVEELSRDLRRLSPNWTGAILSEDPDDLLRLFRENSTPARLSWGEFQNNLLGGGLCSLIFGLIFHRKPPPSSYDYDKS